MHASGIIGWSPLSSVDPGIIPQDHRLSTERPRIINSSSIDYMQYEEHISCPSCGHSCRIRAEHLGKRVACPKCKQPFAVPPPAPPPTQTQSAPQGLAPNFEPTPPHSAARYSVAPSKTNRKWKPSTFIAFAMLGVTLLLPVSMVAMAMFTVASNDQGRDIGGGMYMRTDARGLPDIGYKSDRDTALGAAALISGVCCPLVPYVILMLILGMAYFAFRSAGS